MFELFEFALCRGWERPPGCGRASREGSLLSDGPPRDRDPPGTVLGAQEVFTAVEDPYGKRPLGIIIRNYL